ncbi:hypothetical protein ETAA8_09620 [Anatilimnocola aggregata]|uniref:Uncharacterized protein n=1 Tax=Anatilimnocola aggregata TaxID=2528021 RepID=A0A517Y6P2_9BACT|nr:hypothetical protein ETAA8_09620 [Anatilimnocola aggregata]
MKTKKIVSGHGGKDDAKQLLAIRSFLGLLTPRQIAETKLRTVSDPELGAMLNALETGWKLGSVLRSEPASPRE